MQRSAGNGISPFQKPIACGTLEQETGQLVCQFLQQICKIRKGKKKAMKNSGTIIDLHCDTVLLSSDAGKDFRTWNGHINLKKLQQGGCLAQCFALFIPAYDALAEYSSLTDPSPRAIYEQLLRAYRENLARFSEILRPALSAEDVRANAENGFLSALLTVEDGMLVEGETDFLDRMEADGVRMLALTWNYENCIGYPNSPDPSEHTGRGLKEFGFEVIDRMNSLGMIIDVSHLSEAGFMDVARCSRKPFAASHSCCRALCGHQRNLTDEQLRILGDCGGVVGINFYSRFLTDGSENARIEDIVRHMKRIRDKAGIESLAWGSDFDGFETGIEFGDYAGMPRLIDALSRDFTEDEIDRINSGNFLRLLKEVRN